MGILDRLNPFVQVMYDDKLNEKRKKLDYVLTFVLIATVTIYMVVSYQTWLNPNTYSSKCLTAGISLTPKLMVKDLCYTPEKPLAGAMTAFTCRGTFAAEVWGIGISSDGKAARALYEEHTFMRALTNHPQPNNNNNNNNNNNAGGHKLIPTSEPLAFCSNVIKNEDATLEPFGLVSAASGNAGIVTYDTSKKYTLHGTSDEYYKIVGYQDESTFTCCGWALMTAGERILGYLAAVGGFAGLVQAVLASIPPHHHADPKTVMPK